MIYIHKGKLNRSGKGWFGVLHYYPTHVQASRGYVISLGVHI